MLEAEFRQAVAGLPFEKTAYFSSVGSTNDVAASWASEGAQGLCLAYADEQTSGRGRAGRSWFTPPGSALAFSLLMPINPSLQTNLPGLFSGLGALAVCEALEALYQLEPTIKWPNDVLLEGKKICGVLAEMQWTGDQLQAIILGIGINVAANSVPPTGELNFPATSIEDMRGRTVDAGRLLRGVLEKLIDLKDKITKPSFVKAWEKRLAYKGEQVKLEGGQFTEGRLLGLASDGRLSLQLPNGEEQTISLGEIRIVPSVPGISN